MDQMNELYSYHVFLFPFQWKNTGKNFYNSRIEQRNDLKPFIDKIDKSPKWKRSTFSIDNRLKYNEANYFYDFVRDILYDREQEPGKHKDAKDEKFIAHYYYNIQEDTLNYTIRLKDKTYSLLIDSIVLHLYSTGVGVLSFHLNNRDENQKEPDDILKINQYGRRLYPPFFGLPREITGTKDQYLPGYFMEGLELASGKELPEGISIFPDDQEGYLEYGTKTNFNKSVFILPSFIRRLFTGIPLVTSVENEKECSEQILISPVLDDRMFVLCWYGNDKLSEQIKEASTNKVNSDAYHEWFYKYLFVDGGLKTCQNDELTRKFLEEQTNHRWSGFGTIYGVSRYSFVCLTSALPTLKHFDAAYLVNHMQTMYYKLVELCLVQRACVLRFSDEVTEISGLMQKDDNMLAEKVSELYKQYIRFVNKIYFREVTAQEQGIELYDLLQKHMKMKDQVKDLDDEINELHSYVLLEQQSKENKVIGRLTKLTAILLPASLFAGIFGMNTFQIGFEDESTIIGFWFILSIGIIVISSLVFWFIFIKWNTIKWKRKIY